MATLNFTPALANALVARLAAGALAPVQRAEPVSFRSQRVGTYQARVEREYAVAETAALYQERVASEAARVRQYQSMIRQQVAAANALTPEFPPEAQRQVDALGAKLAALEDSVRVPAVTFGRECADLRGKVAACMAAHPDRPLECYGLTAQFAKCGREAAAE